LKTRYLDDSELKAVFSQIPEERRLIFEVALNTGMRIGDVLKIRGSDIKTNETACFVRFTAEKTGKNAIAPITDPKIAKKLQKLAKKRRKYIFPSDNSRSGHLTRQAAWKWFKTAAKKANVDTSGCSLHSLRKVFAVDLRHREGLKAVQTALQHQKSFTTAIYAYADVYAGADPEQPILWGQVEQLLDLIQLRFGEK
jgi:integrase/recombinase XerD